MTINLCEMCVRRSVYTANARAIMTLFVSIGVSLAFNYDYASSCARPYRSARSNSILEGIPCNLNKQSYCNQPGSSYPWHAVRRFVHENQGLMRRMYGEQRHITVLKTDLENNEIEGDPEKLDHVKTHIKDDAIIRTKQFYSRIPTARASDLKTVPHFRPSHTTPKTNRHTVIDSRDQQQDKIDQVKEIVKKIESINKNHSESSRPSTTTTPAPAQPPTTGAAAAQNESDSIEKVASYKTTFLQDDLHEVKVEFKENVNLHQNKIEPEIVTLATKQNAHPADRNKTTNVTINTTTRQPPKPASTATTPTNNLLLSEIVDEADTKEDIEMLEELTTESSEEADWKPMTIDPSTLPPTLLFSEYDKHKYDRVESVIMDEETINPSVTSPPQASQQQSSTHPDQDLLRPVIKLKGVNACPVKEEVVAPFWANNTRGEILALLNLYPFEQYVHWEKCSHEHKQMYCREGCRCEQQYRLHRLLAYDPNNECRGIFSDWFKFPSCCVCKCYDVPLEYRVTSRSPRILEPEYDEEVKQAIYEDAASDWYTIDLDG